MQSIKSVFYIALCAMLPLLLSSHTLNAAAKIQLTIIDQNNDGTITRREWRDSADRAFNQYDLNGDGVIAGYAELKQSGGQTNKKEANFRRLDVDNDGFISRDEWNYTLKAFNALDRNGDGRINRNEFFNPEQTTVAIFSEIDINGDRLISRNEWNGSLADFNRLDRNRDNRLSEKEFYSSENETKVLIDQLLQQFFQR